MSVASLQKKDLLQSQRQFELENQGQELNSSQQLSQSRLIFQKKEPMDPMEEFAYKLQNKQKYYMHRLFFEQDPDKKFIVVPVLTDFTGENKPLPFRNIKCTQPNCVYDLEELKAKYRNALMSKYITFSCRHCRNIIEMKDFFLDQHLSEIIDVIWEKYNQNQTIRCPTVTIIRDGYWEPNIPNYIRRLEKNLDLSGDDNFKYKIRNPPQKPEVIEQWDKPSLLLSYSKAEHKELYNEFLNETKTSELGDVVLKRYDVNIRENEFSNMLNEASFAGSIVHFVLAYLQHVQQTYPDQYNKKNKNRFFFLLLKVKSFDKYYKQAKSEYYAGFKQREYYHKPEKILKDFDKICLVMYYDDRWILYLVELVDSKHHLIDFLDEDLCRSGTDELLEIGKSLIQGEFQIKCSRTSVYGYKKLTYYNDCGLHVCNFVYKCFNNPSIENIKIQFEEKQYFKNSLSWLVLKLRKEKPQKILLINDEVEDDSLVDKSNISGSINDKLSSASRAFSKKQEEDRLVQNLYSRYGKQSQKNGNSFQNGNNQVAQSQDISQNYNQSSIKKNQGGQHENPTEKSKKNVYSLKSSHYSNILDQLSQKNQSFNNRKIGSPQIQDYKKYKQNKNMDDTIISKSSQGMALTKEQLKQIMEDFRGKVIQEALQKKQQFAKQNQQDESEDESEETEDQDSSTIQLKKGQLKKLLDNYQKNVIQKYNNKKQQEIEEQKEQAMQPYYQMQQMYQNMYNQMQNVKEESDESEDSDPGEFQKDNGTENKKLNIQQQQQPQQQQQMNADGTGTMQNGQQQQGMLPQINRQQLNMQGGFYQNNPYYNQQYGGFPGMGGYGMDQRVFDLDRRRFEGRGRSRGRGRGRPRQKRAKDNSESEEESEQEDDQDSDDNKKKKKQKGKKSKK